MTTIEQLDDPDVRRGLAVVADAVPDADPRELVSTAALALLTPGTFAAGRARFALGELARDGFRPAYACFVQFDHAVVERMWVDSLAKMAPDRRVVVHDLLAAAESLLLLLVDDAGSGATERLAELKGHSDPARNGPRTLRARFGAANRVINLLHTAETTADTVRELTILLGEDDLATAWRSVASGRVVELDGSVLDVGTVWCGNSIAHLAAALRSRLADGLAAEVGSLDGVTDRVGREWAWVSGQPVTDPRGVLAAYRSEFPTRLGDCGAGRLSTTGAARARAIAVLDDLLYGTPVPVELLRGVLRDARCVVEPWEWVVLASSAVSPLAPGPGTAP